mmetsp:Transcript_6716/g.9827  ORF Transcript_6716/g.9827 Transcript_6716/m.9827 type:complete len:597 (-) Transcript_6716:324-2114(-)
MKAPLFLLGLGFTNFVKGEHEAASDDSPPPAVTGVLELDEALDGFTQCAGVSFDYDSCVMSSALLSLADHNGPLGNLTAVVLGCPEESCDPPPEDLSGILNGVLDNAIASCGEETSAEEIENITESLDQLLAAEDCHLIDSIGDIDTLTGSVEMDLSLAYVAQCADVEVDAESCVFLNSMNMLFESPDDDNEHSRRLSNIIRILEGDDDGVCEAPKLDSETIDYVVYQAGVQCQLEGHEVTFADTAATTITLNELFGSESEQCWLYLCSEDAELALISSWLDFCADIQLPFPLPPEEDMLFNPEYYEPQVKLSCMVQFAMSGDWAVFGEPPPSPGSPEECLPPGHYKMETFCPSTIGPIALEHCKNVTLLDTSSPANAPAPSSSPISSSSQTVYTDSAFVENLCDVMIQLSQEHVKEDCLLPLCANSGDPSYMYDDWYDDDDWKHPHDDASHHDDWQIDDWFHDDWSVDDWHTNDDWTHDDWKIDDWFHDDDIDDDHKYNWHPPSKAPTMKPTEIVPNTETPSQQPSAKPPSIKPKDEETALAPSEPVPSSQPTYDFGFDDDVTFGSAISFVNPPRNAAIIYFISSIVIYFVCMVI